MSSCDLIGGNMQDYFLAGLSDCPDDDTTPNKQAMIC